MNCQCYFFYPNEIDYETIFKNLESQPKSRIITDSMGFYEFLKIKNIDVFTIDELVDRYGKLGEKVYKKAKKLQIRYKELFSAVNFKDIKIFDGFDKSLLMKLIVLTRAEVILNDKQNTIFILKKFNPIYFAVLKLASTIGYKKNFKIGHIKKSGIKFLSFDENQRSISYKQKNSKQQALNYFKSSINNEGFFEKIKSLTKIFMKILSLYVKRFTYNLSTNKKFEENILKNVDKKMSILNLDSSPKCALFITATRLDLYLRPWIPVFKILKENNIPYIIFTSDLATSIALSKADIQFVDLFEDVNLLIEKIKNDSFGKQIHKNILNIVKKNNSLLGLVELANEILGNVYRSMAITIICNHIISRSNLVSMIAGADGEMLESLSIEICRHNKIKSYAIIPGVTHPEPIFADWFHADRIFVNGTQGYGSLISLNYNQDRILVSGNPKYDYFKTIKQTDAKSVVSNSLKINNEKKLIVIGMTTWHRNDQKWMSDFIKFCNKNDFEIIIKIHPKFKNKDQITRNKISWIKNECKNNKYFITYDIPLSSLLAASDLVITDYSSIGLEAILLQKPLISVNFSNEKYADLDQRFEKYGAAIYLENYTEFENVVTDILNKNLYLEKLQEGWKKVTEKYNFKNDGKAAHRIFQHLMGLAN